MSFDHACHHRDSHAISGASAMSGTARLTPETMAKKNKTTTDNNTHANNTPSTALGLLQSAVRKAERAFLNAVEQGQDGASERSALSAAKAELAAYMANRLPITVSAAYEFFAANPSDITSEAARAVIADLRSALSGIAKPSAITPSAS